MYYTVNSPNKEYLALEAIQMDVEKRSEGKATEEQVFNTLQKNKDSISNSMKELVAFDNKTANEYLTSSMAIKYQQRISDLAGELLVASTKLSYISNGGSFYIIPLVQPTIMTQRIGAYKGSVITYDDATKYLKAVKLYTNVIRGMMPVFDREFFTDVSKTEEALSVIADKIKTFDSPLGKFVVKEINGEFKVEFSDSSFSTKKSFSEAGWTVSKLTDYQVQFGGVFLDLSKNIYSLSQAMNRFTMNSPQARMWSLVVAFSERLTEALIRIATILTKKYKEPWEGFYNKIHNK